MTTVTVNELNSGVLFECSGHAGAGEKGKDIVCAGVSALVIALIGRTETLADEHLVKIAYFHASDGEVVLEISWDDSFGRTAALDAIATVEEGFERIARLYPDNVVCDFG